MSEIQTKLCLAWFIARETVPHTTAHRYKKFYLLAFIKHNIFREQLDFMVPKGATIRHAKTLFLDCKIPMPNINADETIKFVELLTQAIINKEQLIKERHEKILQQIEQELLNNQKSNIF
ncbi:hypothetical protein myaer87_22670 [Microcystis aeruginosa NIES-87]|uniref:hypothetical protein n=1 Tax=Microcystis aeruginosa TaxID=1126 RepID=UPI000CC38BA4|nr:hypothetical protein [Microcystis aeruginosa]WNF13296.1 hypothetical protein RKE53_14335 [Microcystis aeruginosa NRERC-214]GBE75040.1 hypothetical protein myaer87_22670 [Microcystis aeruginosa NIES-87]